MFCLLLVFIVVLAGISVLFRMNIQQAFYTTAKPKPVTPLTGSVKVPIFLYHYVEYVKEKNDTIRQSLTVNPDIFEKQIVTLQQAEYTFLTARDLGNAMDGKTELPPKPVMLTFDDGHWDMDTDILPILEKYRVKATVYMVSGLLDANDFMTQEQLLHVYKSGLVEIGAHTAHHVPLEGQHRKDVLVEVFQSKDVLEGILNTKVVSFAYPDGTFDEQAVAAVRDAGFTTAVSTIQGVEQSQYNRFFLSRLRPGQRTGEELLQYLQ